MKQLSPDNPVTKSKPLGHICVADRSKWEACCGVRKTFPRTCEQPLRLADCWLDLPCAVTLWFTVHSLMTCPTLCRCHYILLPIHILPACLHLHAHTLALRCLHIAGCLPAADTIALPAPSHGSCCCDHAFHILHVLSFEPVMTVSPS